ncbi:MAG: acyltransferase [Chthoniobacterales bacterium]
MVLKTLPPQSDAGSNKDLKPAPKPDPIPWAWLSLSRFLLASIVAAQHLGDYLPGAVQQFVASFGKVEAIFGFLLISGLSIGSSINKDADGFYVRRLKRIYPVYLFSIAYLFIVDRSAAFASTPYRWQMQLLAALLFLQNVIIPYSLVIPAWTLATEVWLYTLAPLFQKITTRWLQWLTLGSLLFYAGYTLSRSLLHQPYFAGTMYGINLPCLAFPWLIGFLIARKWETRRQVLSLCVTCLVFHISLVAVIQIGSMWRRHTLSNFLPEYGYTTLANAFTLACVVFILFWPHLKSPQRGSTLDRIFTFLGNISYPLYLTHMTSYSLSQKLKLPGSLAYCGTAAIMACVCYILVDFYSRKRRS